jgi:hypothetical protein
VVDLSGVRYHERAFIAGPTESGKSELLNYILSGMQCQKLLWDSKGHEWTVPGVEPVSDPAAIDWSQEWVHYVTATNEVEEVEEVFAQIMPGGGVGAFTRSNLVVCVHELGDLCEYTTNATPRSVNRVLAQGGAHGIGFLGASQEPVDIPKRAKKEINHAFFMAPRVSTEHLKEVSRFVGEKMTVRELADELDDVHRELGDHSFLHVPRGALQEPAHYGPLPAEHRRTILVGRRQEHARERAR